MNETCWKENFKQVTFSDTMPAGIYEQCTFTECRFEHLSFSGLQFEDCTFTACDLSLINISKTAFRDVKFVQCKMLGLRFDTAHTFGLHVSFEACNLSHVSFYKLNLKKTVFKACNMEETDLAETDLTEAVFCESKLFRAVFDACKLDKADFRDALLYTIDPEKNSLKKTRFSMNGISGLLSKYDILIE